MSQIQGNIVNGIVYHHDKPRNLIMKKQIFYNIKNKNYLTLLGQVISDFIKTESRNYFGGKTSAYLYGKTS